MAQKERKMKNSRYFRHDWGARNDPKILRLVRVKGAEAKAIYWDLVEMLYEEGGMLPIDVIEDVAFVNHVPSETARFVVLDSGLFSYNETHFWSERQQRDEVKIKEISEARQNAGRAGGKASGQQRRSKNEANANQTGTKGEAINKINKDTISSSKDSEIDIESKDSCSIASDEIFQETEIEKVSTNMTPDEMVNIWNGGCGELPKARPLSDKRKQKAQVRIREFGKTRDEQVRTMEEVTARLAKSDFANGKTGGTWRADFGWLIENGENWVKVLEGRYDNRKPQDVRDIKNVNDLW